MKTLEERFEALYAAFGDVPKPTRIEGCPCCISQEEIDVLLTKPLRELTGSDLCFYSELALLTVGEVADYLYYLPRILEVSHLGECWWPEFEMTGRAIGATNPTGWPERRRRALLDVLHAGMQASFDEKTEWTADGLLCAIARMGLDVAPFLRQMEPEPKEVYYIHKYNSKELERQKLANAFWDEKLPGYAIVMEWLTSPRVAKLVETGARLVAEEEANQAASGES